MRDGLLIAASGRTDLVERVASTNNNGYLPELARDPDLMAWLNDNGLTVAEAARIQPAYNGNVYAADDDRDYQRATVAASVVSGGVVTWTLLSDPKRAGYLPGIASIGVGAADLVLAFGGGASGVGGDLPSLNALVGSVTAVAGIVYTVRAINARSEVKPASTSASQIQSWQPLIYNDTQGRTRLGVHLRF